VRVCNEQDGGVEAVLTLHVKGALWLVCRLPYQVCTCTNNKVCEGQIEKGIRDIGNCLCLLLHLHVFGVCQVEGSHMPRHWGTKTQAEGGNTRLHKKRGWDLASTLSALNYLLKGLPRSFHARLKGMKRKLDDRLSAKPGEALPLFEARALEHYEGH